MRLLMFVHLRGAYVVARDRENEFCKDRNLPAGINGFIECYARIGKR